MKELVGWVKTKKYTDDDGKPVCGECKVNSGEDWCRDCNLERLAPGPNCEIWHGESKSGPITVNEAGAIAARIFEHLPERDQALVIVGFQECIKYLAQENKP